MRVRACGVCHTDLHLAEGLFKSFGYDPFPLVPGHEIAGLVEAVGPEVTHLQPGDRVTVYWWHSCGRCRCCLAGEEESCLEGLAQMQATGLTRHGGYAELVSVPADCLVPLPAGIEFADAAPFSCAGLTVYAGLKNAGLRPGQRAAMLGIGGLGHMGLQIARAMGAEVIALTSSDVKTGTRQETRSTPCTSRHRARFRQTVARTRRRGCRRLDNHGLSDDPGCDGRADAPRHVGAGQPDSRPPADRSALVHPAQQRVIGTFLGSQLELHEVLHLAALHGIRPMVERYPLEQANEVHQRLRENKVQFRAVLEPGS